MGINGGEIVKKHLFLKAFGILKIHRLNLKQGEVFLAFLGRANLAAYRVAGAHIKLANLRGRNIDIVGTRQIIIIWRTQKTKTLGENLQNPLPEHQPVFFRLGLEDLKNKVLLSYAA